MRWIVIECILLIERILVTTTTMPKMNSELLCYYLVLLFRWMCIWHIIEHPRSLENTARKNQLARARWTNRIEINARLMVACWFFISLFRARSLSRLHFMCKNKCAHKTFQYKCLTQWYYFSSLFKREYIPFDLGENARNQMKHMHVNESILE